MLSQPLTRFQKASSGIYFDAKRAFYNNTGLGNYSRWLIEEYSKHYSEDQLYLLKPYGKHSQYEEYFKQNNIHKINYSNLLGIPRVYSLLNKVPDDAVFHGLSAEIPLRRKFSQKLIVTIHDLIYITRPQDYSWIDRNIYKAKLKHAIENADVIICISEFTLKELNNHFKIDHNKIKIVYQNCNSIFYNRLSSEEKNNQLAKYKIKPPFWICVSSFNGRKNIRSIINAYSILPKNERVPLLLIGNGSLKKDCIDLTEKHNLSDCIRFMNHIPSNELPAFYQSSLGLIYPSLLEGFGIPAVEAMASGVPIIGHKGSSVEEAAADAGLFVDCQTEKEIANAIMSIQSSNSLRQDLIEKGRSQLTRYNNKELMRQMNEIYK